VTPLDPIAHFSFLGMSPFLFEIVLPPRPTPFLIKAPWSLPPLLLCLKRVSLADTEPPFLPS